MSLRLAAVAFLVLSAVACDRSGAPQQVPAGGPAGTAPGATPAAGTPAPGGPATSGPPASPAPTATGPGTPPVLSSGAAAGTPPGAPPVKPVPAQLPDVVARVNGEAVMRADLEQAIRSVEASIGQPVPSDRRDAVYRQVMDQVIAYRLLAQDARARKIEVTDAELDARLSQIRQQFPNETAFRDALHQRQMTPERLRSETHVQMLVGKIVEKDIQPGISVTEQEVSTFYEENKTRFNEPEAVRASHVLIRTPEKADEATKKQARAQAEEVLKKARAGEDFGKLAREYSQDASSAATSGDLGFFVKGQTVPAFEAAAWALKPGQLSGVVETPFGFHVIKAAEHRPPRLVPLGEAARQIREFLVEQQRQQKLGALVERLKAKGKIEILI